MSQGVTMRRLASAVAATSLVAGAALVIGAAPAGAAPMTLFSSSTPGFQADPATVPAGICFVTITADGGHGATGLNTEGPGGAGASVNGRVDVTPGSTLSVHVAGAGDDEGAGGSATRGFQDLFEAGLH